MAERVGVVLFNLGGPLSLDDVEEFLFNLFMDPYIIEIPLRGFLRRGLVRFIAKRRAEKTAYYYKIMGGKSPQYELTMKQAAALERVLGEKLNAKVYVGMRYFKPTIRETYEALLKDDIENVILLPLYPHYSRTTTLSSFAEWNKAAKNLKGRMKVLQIESYHDYPLYIDAVADRISEGLSRFLGGVRKTVYILFSAHGVPERIIRRGDPYQRQIIETVDLVSTKFPNPHSLAYQSRVGPIKWLGPPTLDEIKRLAANEVKNLLVVPISFVSEHSETLYEVNHLFRNEARQAGIDHFEMMPALNDSPKFIEALSRLVVNRAGEFNLREQSVQRK
ncbi:MAG TPA: ferrochelatase [Candidatus Acidoferrales bacterium]|nr:ferrochelatase [Candidatus Acidoferrales bacterium]